MQETQEKQLEERKKEEIVGLKLRLWWCGTLGVGALRFGVSVWAVGLWVSGSVGFCRCLPWFLRVFEIYSLAVSGLGIERIKRSGLNHKEKLRRAPPRHCHQRKPTNKATQPQPSMKPLKKSPFKQPFQGTLFRPP